jgi:hypothetical protein
MNSDQNNLASHIHQEIMDDKDEELEMTLKSLYLLSRNFLVPRFVKKIIAPTVVSWHTNHPEQKQSTASHW